MKENKLFSFLYVVTLITLLLFLNYCSEDKNNPLNSNENNIEQIEGYSLVWNDEFNDSQVNLIDWVYEVNADGGGNNELQYYTSRAENSFVNEGNLHIVAKRESFTGPDGARDYTSARMTTQNRQTFQYGIIKARIKLPYGQGLWPAFWMLGDNISQVGWPKCGEIDIMEMIGGGNGRDNVVYGTLHWDSNGHAEFGRSFSLSSGIFNNDFHEFTINWDSEKIEMLVDGQVFNTVVITNASMSEFHQPFFIILNVAVGGNWPGAPNNQTVFPQEMIVDYVRVYQKK